MKFGSGRGENAISRLREDAKDILRFQEKLAEARAEFQRRYLAWSLSESEAECARDFRFVRMVSGSTVPVFLEYIKLLDPADSRNLVLALCKKLHAPEILSSHEKRMCDEYHEFQTVLVRHPSGALLTSARVPPEQLEKQDRFLANRPSKVEVQKLFRGGLRSSSRAELGELVIDRGGSLTYEKRVGDWYLVTAFETGGHSQLRYLHALYALSGGTVGADISGGISVLNWTGVFPETRWSWLLPEEITRVVESVHEICRYFLERADDLIAGLPNPLA